MKSTVNQDSICQCICKFTMSKGLMYLNHFAVFTRADVLDQSVMNFDASLNLLTQGNRKSKDCLIFLIPLQCICNIFLTMWNCKRYLIQDAMIIFLHSLLLQTYNRYHNMRIPDWCGGNMVSKIVPLITNPYIMLDLFHKIWFLVEL